LEKDSEATSFWNDTDAARKKMQRLDLLREDVAWWHRAESQASDLLGLLDLVEDEGDESMVRQVAEDAEQLAKALEHKEFLLMFSGDYDRRDAILSIHAGAGGTDSQDWAQMLLRMYLRWAERQDFKTEVLDVMPGEEAGIKSVTVLVSGPYAFGYMKAEKGVHRLVRLSPFDAAHRRHTSFALVEIMPDLDDDVDIDIRQDDLRIDVFRSSGAGGQNVQKNSTAVRITHIPTGIVVACQNERSQLQNKQVAMRILKARLWDIETQKRDEEQARLKGKHVDAGWGNQIRSYVLHPYHIVKDHRTDYEVGNVDGVLDGDITDLIVAYLEQHVKEPSGTH
jgi:peptide chain release factor 2